MLSNVLFLQLPILLVLSKNIPSYVKFCRKNDPDLGKCILNSSNEIVKHGYEAIPDMDLPALDPLHINKVSVDTDGSVVKIHVDLIDCIFKNVANSRTNHFEADLEKARFSGRLYFPNTTATSNYTMTGKIINFDIQAKGSLSFEAINTTSEVEWYGSYYMKNNKKHMIINKIETKTNVQEIKIYFYKLFGDNEELTDSVNKIINENIQELKKDLEGIIEKTIGEVSMTYFNRVLNVLSVDELFPDD
ncbi:hypothetical protein FQR65_LT06040 [Abscondita terminalis]|nr:hypothetical protein FQR65_LT06040 [Abscondita terminalis]